MKLARLTTLKGKEIPTYSSDSEFGVSFRNANGVQERNSTLKSCKYGSQDDLTLGLKNKKLTAKLSNLYVEGIQENSDSPFFPRSNERVEALAGDEKYLLSLSGQKSESISIASNNLPPTSSSIASSPASWMDSFLRRFTTRKELHQDGKANVLQTNVQESSCDVRPRSINSTTEEKVDSTDCYSYLTFEDLSDSTDIIKSALERKYSDKQLEISNKMFSDEHGNENRREPASSNIPQKKELSTLDTFSTCSSLETETDELFALQHSENKTKEFTEFPVPNASSHFYDYISKLPDELPPNDVYISKFNNQTLGSKRLRNCDIDDRQTSISSVSGYKRNYSKSDENQKEDFAKSHGLLETSQSKEINVSDVDYPLALSLCGHLIRQEMPEDVKTNIFEHNRIGYSQFSSDPSILSHPNLLMRVGGKLMKWKEAGPLIVSILAFAAPLDTTNNISSQKKKPENREEHGKKRFSWFGFRSSDGNVSGEPLITDDMIAMVERDTVHANVSESGGKSMENSVMSNTETQGRRFLIKTRRPSKEALARLPLRCGMNVVKFVVNSTLQGVQELSSRIFLWSSDSKIVVSDVDGTITRSDVLGHLLPRVGKDWSHEGIAKLYTLIARNGYKMLYLTSRAIGQATSTRAYIQSLYQDSKYTLPEGPVVMSPDRLVESLAREVIRKRPQEFKIAALRNVKELFADSYNAFYAGFGNRYTDLISYRAVGIRSNRIFLINWKGELQICNYVYETVGSYRNLQQFVNEIFVDISFLHGRKEKEEVLHEDDYNDFNFWKRSMEVNSK
ncbi:Phosphatidate phosphatase PAH2 [Galdieria sulphuraria]|nr:Phosphatidate phosphatase PAH2 [Galdieria sulphuraria]